MPITFQIRSVTTYPDLAMRSVLLKIEDGTDRYLWSVGGLPLEGDLNTLLEARKDSLWVDAQRYGQLLSQVQQILREDAQIRTVIPREPVDVATTALGIVLNEALNQLRARVNTIDLRTGGTGDLPITTVEQGRALVQSVIDQLTS